MAGVVDLGEQHDDHIWLTYAGEGWAIRRIEGETKFFMWRGYEPKLEYRVTIWPKEGWPYYSELAALKLKVWRIR